MAAAEPRASVSYARRTSGHTTASLYRTYGTMLFRYAWHLMGSREDAEDATQAAFLSAHSALEQGTTPLEPRAWLLRIVRNECLTRLTERSRRPATIELASVADPPAREPGVERQAELRGEVELARRLLGRLPSKQREAFVLREWVGCSQQEVALALGVSVASVEGLLGRARSELVRGLDAGDDRASCQSVRDQLADAELTASGHGHLLRCARCRAARRLLYPSRASALARGFGVPALIAERLAEQLPGFSAGAATAGGGGLAAIGAKLASMPIVAKLAVGAATAVVAGGTAAVAVREHGGVSRPAPQAAATSPSRGGGSGPVAPAKSVTLAGAAALVGTQLERSKRVRARDLSGRTRAGVRGGGAHRVHRSAAASAHARGGDASGSSSEHRSAAQRRASANADEPSRDGSSSHDASASPDDGTTSHEHHSRHHGGERHRGSGDAQAPEPESADEPAPEGSTDQTSTSGDSSGDASRESTGTDEQATVATSADDSSESGSTGTTADDHAGTQTTP